jgi:excisionase family DNA binding protein
MPSWPSPPPPEPASTAVSPEKKQLPPDQWKENPITMSTVIARKWYSTAEVAEMLGYGLTKTKFLVLSGQIRSVKDGRYRRILPEWEDDYIRRVAEDQAA